MIKTLSSKARGSDLTPGWGAIVYQKPKYKTSNIVINSIKTLKMVHIKTKNCQDVITLFNPKILKENLASVLKQCPK